MTSPQERAAEIDRLMALADDWVVAAIHAAISANSGWPTEAKPEKASATLRAALEAAMADAQRADWVHSVQWYSQGGRTRCAEVFADIDLARTFADHLPPEGQAWITTCAVRGAGYVRAFCGVESHQAAAMEKEPK